jgi:chemotaxis protein CheX
MGTTLMDTTIMEPAGTATQLDTVEILSISRSLPDEVVRRANPGPGNAVWMRLLETSTREVFETMMGEPAAPAVFGDQELPPTADFTALVGLSGALEGSLRVRCQAVAAYLMGSRLTGMPLEPQDELVVDALGEIANMVAGNFKSKIPGLADACHLSVPTVFQGQEFTMDSMARGEILESCFLFHGSPFWVSLDLWPEAA